MQKRVFIIHGWGGRPEGGFRPWLKKELEARGYSVEMPEMPYTDNPKIDEWIGHLQSVIKSPDQNTILVGHSLGGQAVLRYLADLPVGVKIGKAVLVAPVVDEIKNLDAEEEKISGLWLKTPIDARKAKKAANEIIGIFSDNDRWIPLSSEKTLREKFGARTIIEHNMGHFSDDENMGEAPVVLQAILGMVVKK
jgi:predicted alpha/beta hydrolase family esterase